MANQKRNVRNFLRLITLAGGAAGLLAGCTGTSAFLNPASSVSTQESNLYRIVLYLSLGMFLLVVGVLLFNLIRYRQKPGDTVEPKQRYGDLRLEVLWTLGPILLVVAVFGLAFLTIRAVAAPAPQPGDLQVRVIGHQWWFEYQYPDLGITTANELHVPVGRTVQLTLTSVDVIHSWWVPQLSGKVDVFPGFDNHLWFKADQTGEFDGQCSEFCGLNHAKMRIKVVVQDASDFAAWVENQQQPEAAPQTALQQQGHDLIATGICSNCHTLGSNQAANNIGPNLTHLMSRSVFAGAAYDLTLDNLKQWLTDNESMKPGNDMNSVKLTSDQVDALMAYLSTLK